MHPNVLVYGIYSDLYIIEKSTKLIRVQLVV